MWLFGKSEYLSLVKIPKTTFNKFFRNLEKYTGCPILSKNVDRISGENESRVVTKKMALDALGVIVLASKVFK